MPERKRDMHDSLTFRLLDSTQPVRPVLKATQPIKFKDFILTVTFDDGKTVIEREDVPTGLLWSTSLECPFVYLPETTTPGNIRLAEFLPPVGAITTTLSIAPWGSAQQIVDHHFYDMVLETQAIGRPAVIIGKEA